MFRRRVNRRRMITENEIKELVDMDFDTFKKAVEALDKPDLITVRKYIQPIYNKYRSKDGEKWLAYIDEIKTKEGRFPTVEERDEYFNEHEYESSDLFYKFRFVKYLISERSKDWLSALKEETKEKYKAEDGTFFAINVETGEEYSGLSKEAVRKKAREKDPDAYLYIFAIGDRYQTVLK